MRDKHQVLNDLEKFYSTYERITIPSDLDFVRNEFKKLRSEVKSLCPDSNLFKPLIIIQTIDDYKCPEIMEKTLELIDALNNC